MGLLGLVNLALSYRRCSQYGTLVNRNKNLRPPGGFILTHTQINKQSRRINTRCQNYDSRRISMIGFRPSADGPSRLEHLAMGWQAGDLCKPFVWNKQTWVWTWLCDSLERSAATLVCLANMNTLSMLDPKSISKIQPLEVDPVECIFYCLLHFETLVKCKMYPKSRRATPSDCHGIIFRKHQAGLLGRADG